MKTALVVGGGPAGLMAADELSRAGAKVIVIDAKPSVGRKFLMAGKSGLNLTKYEALGPFVENYTDAQNWLGPIIETFGPEQVVQFAERLEQSVFTGTSDRIFPDAMKASPLLRAWINRLSQQGVEFRTKWRWLGCDGSSLTFDTPDGAQSVEADVTVFALGGASWARLGSDGHWAKIFAKEEFKLTQFGASNAGIDVEWSAHMQPHFGTPLKAVAFRSGTYSSRGEAVISQNGLEGGGIYSVSRGVREGGDLYIDLMPDWPVDRVRTALAKLRGKTSLTNHIRKTLNLKKHELAMLGEWARPLPSEASELAPIIKNLKVGHSGLRPMDEAISTSGGVPQAAFDENLMLRARPGTFCAGEMLDWEAPTGGYLLTACFATGYTAGRGAAHYLGLTPAP